MKPRNSLSATRRLTWLAALVAIMLLPGVAQSADRLAIPDEHPGPPIYARIIRWVGYTDWAAVVFYRSPDVVPEDFHLGPFEYYAVHYDPALLLPGAPQILLEGFGIWEDFTGPGGLPPYQEVLRDVRGTPLPIWFVKVDELHLCLAAYGSVTVTDLEQMPSLRKGLADSYVEILQANGAAQVPAINIVASGVVVEGEGGDFFMQYVFTEAFTLTQTTLRFEE